MIIVSALCSDDCIKNTVDTSGQVSDDNISNSSQPNHEEFTKKKTQSEKLRCWTLDNLNTLTLNVVTQLLRILRDEGHEDLPKTSNQLLGTKHCRPMKSLTSNRETDGTYICIGIKNALRKVICPDIYTENTISVQLHIDGVSIYNNSSFQVWPIALKVHHRDYESKPVTIALYGGDSKPHSANNYLRDLVEEANDYILNGLILNEVKYSFEIFCMVADSPARAFIKEVKNPGVFFACERCTVEGITKNHKRVYPDMNCELRTRKSFKKKKTGRTPSKRQKM